MRSQRDLSALSSVEFYFIVIVSFSFVYNVCLVYRPNPSFIHLYETFDQLVEGTLKCDGRTLINSTSNNSKQANTPTRCPIDKDRLRRFDDLEFNTWLNYGHVQLGGHFNPIGCEPTQRVAIIIPYRDRREHLEKFSLYIHHFLPDQLISYSIFVIEQSDEKPFNRAKLFNIGMAEIKKLDYDYCCFIFHDVDLLPLDQRNLYMCTKRPRHLSTSVSTMRFKLLYPQLFGSVISMTNDDFMAIGGFSNDFYGWGGEDDDIFNRFRSIGYAIDRTSAEHGIYTMMKHVKSTPNPNRFRLLEASGQNASLTGNNNYILESIKMEQLFTIIKVRL